MYIHELSCPNFSKPYDQSNSERGRRDGGSGGSWLRCGSRVLFLLLSSNALSLLVDIGDLFRGCRVEVTDGLAKGSGDDLCIVVIELLQIALLFCLLLCIFGDGLNLSRNGLVGAESLLANGLIDLLDVVEEFSGDSSLLIDFNSSSKYVVRELVAFGQVLGGNCGSGLVLLAGSFSMVPFRMVLFVLVNDI